MSASAQLAKQLREVYSGGNWTAVNLKETLADVTWKEATTKVHTFNTIAILVYHMNYYITAAMKVLNGGPLESHDKDSFNVPPINTQHDWDKLLDRTRDEAEEFASLVEQLPDSKLTEDFWGKKYGSYFRNISGIIEHIHYHLGQIVLIKKLIREQSL